MTAHKTQALALPEITELVNFTRTTRISPPYAQDSDGKWILCKAEYKPQGKSLEFELLYLKTALNQSDILEILNKVSLTRLQVLGHPSIVLRKYIQRAFRDATYGLWSTNDYIHSFASEEFQRYRTNLLELAPRYFSNPRLKAPEGLTSSRSGETLFRLLLGKHEASTGGALVILLAEAGQGKTYLSRNLATLLASRTKSLVPIFVSSQLWQSMPRFDQTSIWKTIAYSFRHFNAAIPWLDGYESSFLRTALKTDKFCIIFDGFDEFILHNRMSVPALETLRSLYRLTRETGARILLTSRRSFWDTHLKATERNTLTSSSGVLLFNLLPFDFHHAKAYFEGRFTNQEEVRRGLKVFNSLRTTSEDLVGRGFVLNLIADLAGGNHSLETKKGAQGLIWLFRSLCRRERARHKLPYSADEQLQAFRLLAAEKATGEKLGTPLLLLALQYVSPKMQDSTHHEHLRGLEVHPLLQKDQSADVWNFSEEQIEVVFLAQHLAELDSSKLVRFLTRLAIAPSLRQDLIAMLVDLVSEASRKEALSEFTGLLSALRDGSSSAPENGASLSEGRYLAGLLALMVIGRYYPRGSSHRERSEALLELCGETRIRGLNFSGAVGRLDLRGVEFKDCVFDQVTWDNCRFDKQSRFQGCQFIGGHPPAPSSGFGSVDIDPKCLMDEVAAAWMSSIQLNEGARKYTQQDLEADISQVLSKFIPKGGFGFRSVEQPNLIRGPIGSSRHKKDILDVLCSLVLDTHHISGPSEKGYHIRSDAQESVRFYFDNNIFTGPLRETLDRLRAKIGLT